LKQREVRSPWRRFTGWLRQGAVRLFGTGHWAAKALLAGGLAIVATLSLLQTDHRVAADARIEGTLQRAIVAPVAGYLLESSVRAGDQVEPGQVLARIDDRELLLEKRKWESERDKHTKTYQEALANRDRAAISLGQARIAQAEAELGLLDELVTRTVLRAPFGGTLISGDLSRSLGAPLERGQLLFEIVPEDSYRVALMVDDHRMRGIEAGQAGELRLTGSPGSALDLAVERIVPLATADGDGNRFRVEAILIDPPSGLRPGMQGVAKVTTGRVSLLRAWTGDFVDRVRFRIWSLGF
jgi:multidrug resistance efflux pump